MNKDSSSVSDDERINDASSDPVNEEEEKEEDEEDDKEKELKDPLEHPNKVNPVSNQDKASPHPLPSSVQSVEEEEEEEEDADNHEKEEEEEEGTVPSNDSHPTEEDKEAQPQQQEDKEKEQVQVQNKEDETSVRKKTSSRKRSAPDHLSDDKETFEKSNNSSSSSSSPSAIEPPSKVARHVVMTSKRHLSSGISSKAWNHDSASNGTPELGTGRNETAGNGNTTANSTNAVNGPAMNYSIKTNHHSSQSAAKIDDDYQVPESDETYLSIINLETIPLSGPLQKLTPREVCQLEAALQIGDQYSDFSEQCTWQDDWNGNLQLLEKDIILNRDELAKDPSTEPIVLPFCEWVAKLARHSEDFLPAELLFSFVYHMKGTPPMAQRILAHYLRRPANSVPERLKFLTDALRRISHDPNVLVQDGWTTLKSDVPDGASGGTYLIGRRVIWQKAEAIVIAFVRDEDIGDLWKCMWIDDHDTFDLEADELQDALYAWEKKVGKKKSSRSSSASSTRGVSYSHRFEFNRNFTVDGIEDGIILAKSFNVRAARPWPARIMHVSEMKDLGITSGSRSRSSSKNEIHVIFLAPYWNAQRAKSEGSAPAAKDSFSTGPLFEVETIEVSPETVMKYPYTTESGMLDIDKIRNEFSFLGLPKAAFRRFLDSHRLAMALKAYAQKHNLASGPSNAIEAMSSLTDTHPLSIRTFLFPEALLNIPFGYVLSKFPDPAERKIGGSIDALVEPMMRLDQMLKSIAPPHCWELEPKPIISPVKLRSGLSRIDSVLTPEVKPGKVALKIDNFASATLLDYINQSSDDHTMRVLKEYLVALVSGLNSMVSETENAATADMNTRQSRLSSFLTQCLAAKSIGEDQIYTLVIDDDHTKKLLTVEWRKSCERLFRRAVIRMGHLDFGNGVTAVLTDSRCNEHITAKGSYERPVRLPAAIKGAKLAGAGSSTKFPLIYKIEERYIDLAEQKILPMAHKGTYLKKMKDKILALDPSAKGAPLTDNSDGEGGDDTRGSRGSFAAAVTAVAAALKGVDMVVNGKCVNAFCATRPPGHHAGRDLHPMNAVSNGFCILNAAASAALYAASPRSQGGLGLKRVCIIDVDVHHGNGTQDILCSTYDPRFLYISTHAGGAHVNGFQNEDDADADHTIFRRGSLNSNDGIFPGKCGDVSPHPGVLNIPLGTKVTPSDLGTAIVTRVTPAVETFDPDLIIVSAGFDAHVNDPLGMGGLSAQDYGTVTSVICQMALRCCSGRVLSVLEGGYGVPCCKRIDDDLFLPKGDAQSSQKILDLGDDLPENMEDFTDPLLRTKLDKCHQEGFLQCVQSHVSNLNLYNNTEENKNVN